MSAVIKTSEHAEQSAIFEWAEWNKSKYPELELLAAIPNGGKRDIVTAVKLKNEGVKSGVPDIFLFCPRGAYHGLAIELKVKGNKPTENQSRWITNLRNQGYVAGVCCGAKEAIDVITDYLKGAKWGTFSKDLCEWLAWKKTTENIGNEVKT